MRSLQN